MVQRKQRTIIEEFTKIFSAADPDCRDRCAVAPSPELEDRIRAELEAARSATGKKRTNISKVLAPVLAIKRPQPMGFNDGLIIPGSYFPVGTAAEVVRSAAADRAPLRGTVRVIVVLVDFSDKAMTETKAHFEELFFSTGVLAKGSVREYYTEVTHGLVDVVGQVVGPYRMPRTLAQYANGASGTGDTTPNARDLAKDAVLAADADVNFAPYDNDANGFVDAFIVIHAGRGAEETGNSNDIWSHKWVFKGGAYSTDGVSVYGYLTVPEDARIGVCCHELGHLLFGWPDLYDTDGSSSGLGNWCLMAGGSWNDSGNTPSHPSAWCKANQGWVSIINQANNATVNIEDVKSGNRIYRLWKDGGGGSEYFLVENRQKTRYDLHLPGEGLLIWHIDDSISTNTNEVHPKVALMQADARNDLGSGANRGDAGDPYPGSSSNRTFDKASTPGSKSYAGVDTCVAVSDISGPAPIMSAKLSVQCAKIKEKEVQVDKRYMKEWRYEKWTRPDKRLEKPIIDKRVSYDKDPRTEGKFIDKPTDGGGRPPIVRSEDAFANLEARVSALEAQIAGAQPFIGSDSPPRSQIWGFERRAGRRSRKRDGRGLRGGETPVRQQARGELGRRQRRGAEASGAAGASAASRF